MISLKKALRFAYQPNTFIVSFFWLVFYVLCLLGIAQFIKSLILNHLTNDGLPKNLEYIVQGYGVVCLIGCILTETYFLIVAKKNAFEQPVVFSLSFFTRKAMLLLLVFLGYSLLSWLIVYPIRLDIPYGFVLTIGGMIILFYTLTAFLIAFIECFSFDSVCRLFPKIFKKPLLILMLWFYLIVYSVIIYFLMRFLEQGTRWVVKELIPLLLPCGMIAAIIICVGGSIPLTLLYRMLPRKGRFYLLASLIFIIPTIILYEIIGLPINFLMFLVVGQVIWYWAYFGIVLTTSIFAFSAYLMAQACRRISDIKSKNNP